MKDGRYNLWESGIRLCYYSAIHCNDGDSGWFGSWYRRHISAFFWALGFLFFALPYVLWMMYVRKTDSFAYMELF